jgi:hypothetical protein
VPHAERVRSQPEVKTERLAIEYALEGVAPTAWRTNMLPILTIDPPPIVERTFL